MNRKYKKTELGLIPDDWEVTQLGQIAKIRMCKRIFADQTTEKGDIPFYKIGTFGGKPDAYISRRVYEEYKAKYSYPEKGDILVSAAGTLGRTVIYDGKDAYFQDSNIVWLDIDKEKICNEYLEHYYKIIKWASSEGSTISRLYNGIIESTYIAYPQTIAEQKHIAEALSDIDELISSLEKLITKKKAIKQGTMQQLLTSKTRLTGYKEKWEEKSIEDIAELSTTTVGTDQINTLHYVGTENMIKDKGGVRDNDIAVGYRVVREYRPNDILLSNIRPYLKKIWLSNRYGGCSNDVIVIRVKNPEELSPVFLYYLLSQDAFFEELMANAIGTKMPRGDKITIKTYIIKYPSDITEQRNIAEMLCSMDCEIEVIEKKLAKTQQIKQGVMQQLLTGKTRLV